MGRITISYRQRLTKQMQELKRNYRAAFKDPGLQEAFDELWETWDREMAAIINYSHPDPLVMLILTAVVDNRREIMRIREELDIRGEAEKQKKLEAWIYES